MSSVSSSGGNSGSSGADDATRKLREEYRKKEAALIKKHQNELQAIDQKYSESINSKDKSRAAELSAIKEKASQSLSKRDQRYQKEIDDLRKMHTTQLERLMNDNALKTDVTKQAARSEIKQANLGKEDRTAELNNKYSEAIANAESNYIKNVEEMREQQKKSLDATRAQINEAHNKEMETFRDYHNESVSGLKNDLRQTRTNANQRLRNQEVQHSSDKMRIYSNHMNDAKNREEAQNQQLGNYSADYKESLKDVREKYGRELEKRAETQNQFQSDFKNSVEDRIDSRESRLESELSRQKEKVNIAEAQANRKASQQIKNVQNSYQDKFEYLENARKETLDMANQENANNIKKIRAETDKIVSSTTRRTLANSQAEGARQRQALDQARNDFEVRNEFKELATEGRVDLIRNDSITKEKRLRENFQTSVEMLKENKENEAREQRAVQEKDKILAVQGLREQLQRTEGEGQQKLADLTSKYEKRISELNDQFVREKRMRDAKEKQLVTELKKANDAQVEAVKMKYEDQNRQTQAKYEKEIKDVTRRNKDHIDNIMSVSKKA
ncbi:MAG: hypothetical protein AABZ31_14330 [Bdellovibrionota bacterium]